ncbi:MAG: RnfABCDGE type electron transport complex subunit G [Clostridium sp.]|nr:RnfABCDGE type electron transport complex subunit G [Clostridium sp.]MCM1398136.1 RnfABCDGE type electron transport complex subunit G [Clostridium sp.]
MGAALGVVHNVTKKPIEDVAAKAKQESYQVVFPEANEILTPEDGTLDYKQMNDLIEQFGYPNDTIDEIGFAVDDKKEVIGYVIVVTNKNGYGGDIQMVVGISKDKWEITGLEFLSISETVGLGMKAKEQEFKDQFAGQPVDKFDYTKTGSTSPNVIDAISGATITTSAVVDGVNAAVTISILVLGGDSNE